MSAVLGACIGSFLNVVIYRLPRGLSVSRPRRSFCPNCERTIAGYDNVPVVSYLLLRGRCRHCRALISPHYPIIELLTSLLFVATYDALVVQRWRLGVGLWPQDGAIVAAHWLLWAGLLATAVMDIEVYYLDVRVTWFVAAAGVFCHMLWTPDTSQAWIRPGPSLTAGAIAASLALGVTFLCSVVRERNGPEEPDARGPDEPEPAPAAPSAGSGPPGAASPGTSGAPAASAVGMAGVVFGVLVVVGYIAWMSRGEGASPLTGLPGLFALPADWRFLAVVAGLMAMIVVVEGAPRAADEEVFDAIQAESGSARRLALAEAAWLAPAVIIGVGGAWAWSRVFPPGSPGHGSLVDWSPMGQWRPILGLATGLTGWLIAGALGWAVRLVFTVLLGKEALGTGDIHILAAAGAVAGWPVVVFGFFLSAPLALIGVLFFTLRRSSRAIQYGPWLGLGFFVAAAAQDRIIEGLRIGWLFR